MHEKIVQQPNIETVSQMIIEHRSYTLHPGKVAAYMRHYQNEGMAIQLKYLPCPLGYYTSELGTLNQIIHIWGYESLDQRMRLRERLKGDPNWPVYVSKILPLIINQESKILLPAPFFEPAPVTYSLS